jgi:glutamate/tyrosine decarboxylase-like PLP-dependent enzyme
MEVPMRELLIATAERALQNAALAEVTPLPAKLEDVAHSWLCDVFGLPAGTGMGFVTGATMANFTCLAAARHAVLAQAGWDVEADGLCGAPEVAVVVSEEAHPTLFKSLGLAGFGRNRVVCVPADKQGRMRADVFPRLSGPTIVCLQAGNVNTGAFDPAPEIIPKAKAANAWVHVDGAFGLWAAAAPCKAHLLAGYADADSWAALHTLGRSGRADLVECTCRHAARFAECLRAAGYTVLNEVVLNQVLVTFGDAERTRRVIAGIQRDGTCWCGETVWQGHTAMPISVSSWATTEADVERSLQAMIWVAREPAESRGICPVELESFHQVEGKTAD